jgi:hypothetical protein
MDAVINLQGIKVHVGFYRTGRLYKVDEADCYVTDDAGRLVTQIDNIDLLGEYVTARSWLSLRTIAEMHADEHAGEWERAERLQAQADAITARRVA